MPLCNGPGERTGACRSALATRSEAAAPRAGTARAYDTQLGRPASHRACSRAILPTCITRTPYSAAYMYVLVRLYRILDL